MSNIKRATLISPLLGGSILTFLAIIYILFESYLSGEKETISIFFAAIKLLPLLFFIFSAISYLITLSFGFLIYKDMLKNLRTENFFINMSLFVGFIISIAVAVMIYKMGGTLAKSFFIVIGISIMATANASYFMVLSKLIIIKDGEKRYDHRKGKRF